MSSKVLTLECGCAEVTGGKPCNWVGSHQDMVVVEYPSPQEGKLLYMYRSNKFPLNGKNRVAVSKDCLDKIIDLRGVEIVEGIYAANYAESVPIGGITHHVCTVGCGTAAVFAGDWNYDL